MTRQQLIDKATSITKDEEVAIAVLDLFEDYFFPEVKGATLKDYTTAVGEITKSMAYHVDWEKLSNKEPDAIANTGIILYNYARAISLFGEH